MSYGVTNEGFVLKRLADIKAEIEAEIRDTFGEVNLRPDSVFGQLVGVFSKPAADVWEVIEDEYNSLWPSTAEGVSLDNVMDLSNGLFRLPATKTQVDGVVNGTEGVTVPEGSQAQTTASVLFETTADVEITKDNVVQVLVSIDEAVNAHDYTVTIGGVPYTHTATLGQTTEDIADQLEIVLNAGLTDITAVATGDEIQITADDKLTAFTAAVGDKVTLEEIWTPVHFEAAVAGPSLCVIGSLTEIMTPVSGWTGVNNLIDGDVGGDIETDVEARLRRERSLKVIGAGTLEAIRARLLNEVSGVSQVAAFENRKDYEVDSRPPHSFEMVVEGGEPQDIGDKIWEVKPAGIESHGGITVSVTDSNGTLQDVKFSRAIPIYVHVEVTIEYYNEEEFPVDGETRLKNAIYEYGEGFSLGRDLILQRWLVPIYSVPGIAGVTIRHAAMSSEGASPSWQTVDIAIGSTERVVMSTDRITIILP